MTETRRVLARFCRMIGVHRSWPIERSDPPVAAVLERAADVSADEAHDLAAAVRSRPWLRELADEILDDHDRSQMREPGLYTTWPIPREEMGEARIRVHRALGDLERAHDAVEPDDASVAWGAATAAAYAVLARSRAGYVPDLWAPWQEVIDPSPIDETLRKRSSHLAGIRKMAGVSDQTWRPPPAPDDIDLRHTTFDWGRTDWPAWVTSPDGYAIGSTWWLTRDAGIVAPNLCAYPTLALSDCLVAGDRYAVGAGTRLVLEETHDPDADPETMHLDVASYYQWVEGWSTRTYRISDGPSAGIRVVFSADRTGNRFPYSSRLAHAAIEPT